MKIVVHLENFSPLSPTPTNDDTNLLGKVM